MIGDGRPAPAVSSTRPSKVVAEPQPQRHDLERPHGHRHVAVADLLGPGRLLEQVALPRRDHPPIGPHIERRPVPDRLVEADDEIARAVVGQLDRVDLHPRRGP